MIKFKKSKKKCTLAELPKGSLFSYKGTIGMKSEYRTKKGTIEAFIVGSGEMFWGGTFNPSDQQQLKVRELVLIKT